MRRGKRPADSSSVPRAAVGSLPISNAIRQLMKRLGHLVAADVRLPAKLVYELVRFAQVIEMIRVARRASSIR